MLKLVLKKVFKYKKSLIVCGILGAWFFLHVLIMLYHGFLPDSDSADIAVVLGNKVELNGEPSLRLRYRLDKAVELYKYGPVSNIIVSGAFGKEGFQEAKVMKKYLLFAGVPAYDIIEDRRGCNTRATALFMQKYLKENGYSSVIIVSQYYHILRCKLAFNQAGIKNSPGVAADYTSAERAELFSIIREFVGFYAYLFHLK